MRLVTAIRTYVLVAVDIIADSGRSPTPQRPARERQLPTSKSRFASRASKPDLRVPRPRAKLQHRFPRTWPEPN